MGSSVSRENFDPIKKKKKEHDSHSLLNAIMFQPIKYDVDKIKINNIEFLPSNGIRIPILYIDRGSDRCVIFSHGNAEDIIQTHKYMMVLAKELGINICCYDYQGYGLSQKYNKRPNEYACYKNISDVVEYVKEKGISIENIVLYGRSLGTGVSLYYAAHHNFTGKMILEAAYTNIGDVIAEHTPIGILFSAFPSADNIRMVDCDILFLHGRRDDLIPCSHTERLHKIYRGVMKHKKRIIYQPIIVDSAKHNDIVIKIGIRNFINIVKKFIA